MYIFSDDVLDVLGAFEEAGVRYILVGGMAVNLHGHNRYTGDMDVWLEDTLANRRALRAAFKAAGYGDLEPLERIPFVPGWTSIRMNSGIEMDLMGSISGLRAEDFAECYDTAERKLLRGRPVRFLNLEKLLLAKQAVARPKDLQDIIALDELWGRSPDPSQNEQTT